ncbi:MAG: ABC transporter permease [Candidatus Eisenbacteria bacterium]|nr:ABC transporter permease [Candidatus Eisenbacteria bacterium]
MKLQNIGVVWKKEVIETVRDRRSLFLVFVLPFIFYPMIFAGMGFMMQRQVEKEKTLVVTIAVTNPAGAPRLVSLLREKEKVEVLLTNATSKQIQDGLIQGILVLQENLEEKMKAGEKSTISFVCDETDARSRSAAERAESVFAKFKEMVTQEKLKEIGVGADFLSAASFEKKNIGASNEAGASLLGMLIPYLIIVLIAAGASHPAIDATAGEKERATLETILVSSAKRTELVLGKFLAVLSASLASAFSGIVSLLLTFLSGYSIFSVSGDLKMGVTPMNAAAVFLMTIPVAALLSGVLIAMGCLAKSAKEGGTYAAYLQMAVILLGISAMSQEFEVGNPYFLLPIFNTSLVEKELLLGNFNPAHIVITLGSTIVLAFFSLLVAVRLFSNEEVMFRQ